MAPPRWRDVWRLQRTHECIRQRPDPVTLMIVRRWYLSPLLVIHTVVVVGLAATSLAFFLVTFEGEVGADIGAGLIALPLIPLGLPWSLPNIYDKFVAPILPMSAYDYPYPCWTEAVEWTALYGPALLNVVLHALLTRRLARRRALRAHASPER